jgi:hypothetical protein
MSCAESVDFASFSVSFDNPKELLLDFAEFCFSKAAQDPLFTQSSLNTPFEWEDVIEEFYDTSLSDFTDRAAAQQEFTESVCSAVTIRHRPTYEAMTEKSQNKTFFEITAGEGGVSYDLYIWILKNCLEFSPFALQTIESQAVIYDSREGRSVIDSEYTLADF